MGTAEGRFSWTLVIWTCYCGPKSNLCVEMVDKLSSGEHENGCSVTGWSHRIMVMGDKRDNTPLFDLIRTPDGKPKPVRVPKWIRKQEKEEAKQAARKGGKSSGIAGAGTVVERAREEDGGSGGELAEEKVVREECAGEVVSGRRDVLPVVWLKAVGGWLVDAYEIRLPRVGAILSLLVLAVMLVVVYRTGESARFAELEAENLDLKSRMGAVWGTVGGSGDVSFAEWCGWG